MTIIRLCGQQLKLSAPVIAADTIDYIEMAVDMSEDWQRMDAVFVRFELDNYYVEAQVRDGRIRKEQHLNLTRGAWRVSAYGVRSSGEDIIERITSTTASLDVKVTGAHGGEPLPPDSEGVLEKLKAQIAGKLDKQQSAEDAGKVLGIDEEGRVVPVEGGGGSAGQPGKPALIGSNGNWLIWDIERGEYIDSGKPSRGADGESITIVSKEVHIGREWVGSELVQVRPDWYTLHFSDGTSVDVESGLNGKDGANGVDGLTPYIGENGNWWVPNPGWPTGIDTGKPSRGAPGESVHITDVYESGESGGINVVTFSDGASVTIRNGKDGQGGGMSANLKKALINYITHALPDFDNEHGIEYRDALISALTHEGGDPTLESISVAYTGGTVNLGTTLDELTGITVTAMYGDGHTEIVEDYVLTGSLDAGENVITVMYEGASATFTVTVIKPSLIGELKSYKVNTALAQTNVIERDGDTYTISYNSEYTGTPNWQNQRVWASAPLETDKTYKISIASRSNTSTAYVYGSATAPNSKGDGVAGAGTLIGQLANNQLTFTESAGYQYIRLAFQTLPVTFTGLVLEEVST